jgi:HAD superfamily hydrolase (TIGR01509 family)
VTLEALLWDVDGTLAETERDGHRVAFNHAFEASGLAWRWSVERYGELLAVTGGRERLLHDMTTRADAPQSAAEREALARAVHQRKNALYAEIVESGGIALRPGVLALFEDCRAHGVRMAITTTTSKSNVDALLRAHLGAAWAGWFAAIVCGEDVSAKKPDPEVFATALRRLALTPPQTLAIEDSPGGVAAARAAGVPVVVSRSVYFETATIDAAIAIGPGLGQRDGWRPALPHAGVDRVTLDDLAEWHRRMALMSEPECLFSAQPRREREGRATEGHDAHHVSPVPAPCSAQNCTVIAVEGAQRTPADSTQNEIAR